LLFLKPKNLFIFAFPTASGDSWSKVLSNNNWKSVFGFAEKVMGELRTHNLFLALNEVIG
jgi:hypothetical protein